MEKDKKDGRDIDRINGTIIVRTKPSGAIVTLQGESKTINIIM